MSEPALSAALSYADRGWDVFPTGPDKRPLTPHGRTDATTDASTIEAWWKRWGFALPSIATGAKSGIVAIDIDIDEEKGLNGWDSLEALGVVSCPVTPCDHTPRGGSHLLFRHPGVFIKTIAGKLGPGLDIRGDGGSVILPPGPGRYWDPALGPDTPFADFPAWAMMADPVAPGSPRPDGKPLSRYGEVALTRAVEAIRQAPGGQQEGTLNRECFAIGGLVAGGAIPSGLALDALKWAAHQLPSCDPRRRWNIAELDRKVDTAILAGMRHPRRPAA